MKKKWTCPICKKRVPGGIFVSLCGGGMKGNKQDAHHAKGILGYLHLDLHDDEKKRYALLSLAEDDDTGLFEIKFCSVKCLRKWFQEQTWQLSVKAMD